jgi:tyrosinase
MKDYIYEQALIGFSYEEGYKKGIEFKPRRIKEIGIPTLLRERKNVNKLNDDEKKILISALENSIKSGEYAKLVTFHSQYMYDIHSFGGGPHVNQRFLPWHRVYLVKLEEMLNNTMKQENPGKEYNIAFPYWDWEHDRKIPDLFLNFTPTMNVEVYQYINGQQIGSQIFNLQVKRFPDPDLNSTLPTSQIINRIKARTTFFEFTDRLEKNPHNDVHGDIGGMNPNHDPNNPKPFDERGTMGDPYISPLDVLFWCHHGNIDRIWAGWQKMKIESGNTEFMHPGISGTESEMTPWFPEYSEPQTRQIESMGYKYDVLG